MRLDRMTLNRVLAVATLVCGVAFALSMSAKTVIHLIDAQGKSVGTVILWEEKGGAWGCKSMSRIFRQASTAYISIRTPSAIRPTSNQQARILIPTERSTAS